LLSALEKQSNETRRRSDCLLTGFQLYIENGDEKL